MALEPVKIPQNVHIEDRVVGPFSLKQIILIVVGGGFSYALYTSISKAVGGHLGIVPTVLVCIPGFIALLFAIVKVNDLSLFRLCLLLIESFNKPKVRMWEPRSGLTITIHSLPKELQAPVQAAPVQTNDRIRELSAVLDQPMEEAVSPAPAPEPTVITPKQPTPQAIQSAPVQEATPAKTEQTAAKEDDTKTKFPVDKNRVSVDPHDDNDGLSTYKNVFTDIYPRS